MSIGENIKKFREKRNMTQQQLADSLGLRQSYIAQLERGSRVLTIPPVQTRAKTQSAAFKEGDIVRVLPTAQKYVNSDILIPDRYKTANCTDTVHQASRDGNSVLLAKI